jgi:methylated-DNA-[protein]-cysteine S-methyltransferase
MERIEWDVYESPIGALTLVGGGDGLRTIEFPRKSLRLAEEDRRELGAVSAQLEAYFAGELREFELPLDLRGDPLQLAIWAELRGIPYGETTTYGELASRIDESLFPRSAEPYLRPRIVGANVGRTPTPIVVPCHRVIGADGSLTGYGGGLQRKQALLDLEREVAGGGSAPASWSDRQIQLL